MDKRSTLASPCDEFFRIRCRCRGTVNRREKRNDDTRRKSSLCTSSREKSRSQAREPNTRTCLMYLRTSYDAMCVRGERSRVLVVSSRWVSMLTDPRISRTCMHRNATQRNAMRTRGSTAWSLEFRRIPNTVDSFPYLSLRRPSCAREEGRCAGEARTRHLSWKP